VVRLNRFDRYWVAAELGIPDPDTTFGGLRYAEVVDWLAFLSMKYRQLNAARGQG